jgi:branched-chain amino acid transport system permease protein
MARQLQNALAQRSRIGSPVAIQVLANGIISGLTLAVLALAFSLVYLPCRVFHIALGGVYSLTPYIALTALAQGWPWATVIAASVAGAVATSLICELANHRSLERRRAPPGAHLIASLGLYIVIVQLIAIVWGPQTQVLRAGVGEFYKLAGESVVLTRAQLLSAGVSVAALATFYGWLRLSQLGLRFRALADNPVEFALLGFNVNAYRALAFGLSGLLAGTASLLIANDLGFEPHGGMNAFLLAVVAVTIGGRRSYLGPVLGGLLLGLLRTAVVWFLSARWQDVATFAVLAAFLYIRPEGILARHARLEAAS